MADKRFKEWIAHRFGARLHHGFYRIIYNLIAVISLLPALLALLQFSTILYAVPEWLAPIFMLIQLIGSVGLIISILQIDWLRFAGFKQVSAYFNNGELPLPNESLVTTGLYAFVRHPLYFFSLLSLWFSPVMSERFFYFNIAATAYFVFGSLIEEQRMLAAYGESYANYQKNVGWLIPFVHLP